MTAQLKLSRDLSLPVEIAGEAIAILAKRGAGKTNTATVLVEELYAADVQTVVLDPVGVWWGLRSSADGERAGLKVAIIGGAHGDVPIEDAAGKLLADVAVDSGQSLVLDLSEFPSKAAMTRFVTDFAQRLYSRKARNQTMLHVVLEEADVFAPQSVRGGGRAGEQHAAIEQIVRRGRSRGLGVTLITQRSAVLNKDVLTQADVLIVMRTTGPQDVKAVGEWVNAKGDEHGREVLDSLPGLATGEAWIWNPERELLDRTKVRARRTFDSSKTPKAGERRAEPRRVAEVDLTKLGEQIAATVERAKANDPRELRRQIGELQRELAAAQKAPDAVETITVEKPVISADELQVLQNTISDALGLGQELLQFVEYLREATQPILNGIEQVTSNAKGQPDATRPSRDAERGGRPAPVRGAPRRAAAPARPASRAAADGDQPAVSGPQQRILDALAQLEAIGVGTADKTQLALFAKASPKSSAYSNNLGHLNNQAGLIHYPRPGYVALTEAGRAAADASAAPETTEDLHDYVYSLVGAAKSRILEVLISQYPNPVEKELLADAAGASPTSSAFSNNLGSLRSLGLIEYPQRGMVVAQPVLFLEEAAVA